MPKPSPRRPWPTWATHWATAASLYLVTVAVRLWIWRSPLYGDEAWHFYMARHLGADAHNVHTLLGNDPAQLGPLFWWRPLFFLLLSPAAQVSFDAWRLAHVLVTSLLPVLVLLLLRRLQARPVLALGASLAVVLEPVFQTWGVLTFPDGLLTTAFAASLLAWTHRKPVWAAAAFTAALWIKEVAIVGIAFLFAASFLADWRAGRAQFFPLRLSANQVALLVASLLGLYPLYYYLSLGGNPPGWSVGGDVRLVWESVFLQIWFAPLVALGLRWPRTRFWSGLGLAYPAFYLLYRLVLGRGVEGWYMVLPNLLVLVALALTIDEAWSRSLAARHPRAFVGPALGGVVALLLAVQIFAPLSFEPKAPLVAPFSRHASFSLPEVADYQQNRERDVFDIVDHLRTEHLRTVALFDVGWFFPLYPFSERAEIVRTGYTVWYEPGQSVDPWVRLVEEVAAVTVLGKQLAPTAFHAALLSTYGDCTIYENESYVVIEGRSCAGRADRLAAETSRRTAGA